MTRKRAYMFRVCIGRWGFEPVMAWKAEDAYGGYVGMETTRKKLERTCRDKGYVPVKEKDLRG